MASVYRRPRSQYWHAGWRDADGKFQLRSTKQTERNKALQVAVELERVDRKTQKGEMVETQVRQVLNDILEKVGEPLVDIPTIRKWFLDWLKEKTSSKSEGTAERYKYVVDAFLAHLKDRADKLLTVLTARDVQSYVAKRIEQKVASATVNVDGKILRTCLNRAKRQGLISINPAEAVELPANRPSPCFVADTSDQKPSLNLSSTSGLDSNQCGSFSRRLIDCASLVRHRHRHGRRR
jgi:hypothetical protein